VVLRYLYETRANGGNQRTQPCRLLIDEIEAIREAIAARDDWALFQAKLDEIVKRRESAGAATEQLSSC
jgi:protein adenylyltransferase